MAIIPVLGRLRQDYEFKTSLGYTMRLCLKQEKKKLAVSFFLIPHSATRTHWGGHSTQMNRTKPKAINKAGPCKQLISNTGVGCTW